MAEIYEAEINGRVLEIEAEDEEDFLRKAKRLKATLGTSGQTQEPESGAGEEKKPGYFAGLGEYFTKDIPESFKGLGQRTAARVGRADKETSLGSAARKATGAEGIMGNIIEGVAGAPERHVRGLGAITGTYGEIPGMALELGGKMANRISGGKLGEIAKPIARGIAESKPVQKAGEWWEGLGEADKANIATGVDLLEALGWKTGSATSKTAKKANKLLGGLAQEATGVPEDALRKASTKAGRQALEAASGKQYEIGKKLVKMVDNVDDFMPERKIVENALQNMPDVKLDKIAQTLESAKVKKAFTEGAKNANKKIDELISTLTQYGDDLPASDFRQLRKQLDNEIKAAFGKDYQDYFESAVKKARKTMKEELIDSAKKSGNTQYVEAMEVWADKIEKVEKLKSFLGKDATTRANRAQSFVSNIFGKNRTEAQKALADAEDIFGTNLLSDAKLAQMAGQLGPEGKASLLPRQLTGRSLLAIGGGAVLGTPLLGFAAGSPKIASRVAIPFAQGIQDATSVAKPFMNVGGAGAASLSTRRFAEDEEEKAKRRR